MVSSQRCFGRPRVALLVVSSILKTLDDRLEPPRRTMWPAQLNFRAATSSSHLARLPILATASSTSVVTT